MTSVTGMAFAKLQGLGNDFVLLDRREHPGSVITPERVRILCDRRFGIGADQVLVLAACEPGADARMDIWNADGSRAEMCGNGIRAAAVYLSREPGPLAGKSRYRIETLAGILTVEVKGDGAVAEMGVPRVGAKPERLAFEAGGRARELEFTEVNLGNPHAVVWVQDVARYPVEVEGPAAEVHPRFPARTNIEFVEVLGRHRLKVRVWERGAGLTLACGTGACAAAVAAIAAGKAQSPVEVELPGGSLTIRWEGPGQPVWMEGPASEVFRGEIRL